MRIVFLALLAALLIGPASAAGQAPAGLARAHPDGASLLGPDGRALFVFGYNYEGPADRAWQMWERFDLALIEEDFARARAGGANSLRIFVQEPLPAEVLAGDFAKLDSVVAAAARQGLFLIVTLADYPERDLVAIAEVNARIAARYAGNPAILAYDLRNEPQFLTLAVAGYPAGVGVPLQSADLVAVYGERVARADIPAWRSGPEGRVLPAAWDEAQAYAYANNLNYFREYIAAAEQWTVAEAGRSILEFPAAPDAAPWRPLIAALDATLAAWIGAQSEPIRRSDPGRLITVGWSSLVLAPLPANRALDVLALHRFPRPTAAGVAQTLALGASLRRAIPNRPLLFEEVGVATSEASPEQAAILETAMALRAYGEGYAGFLKWMLTDLPPVGDPREDSFGALRLDGSPKPSYLSLGALGAYSASSVAGPGATLHMDAGATVPGYVFTASDAVGLAGQGRLSAGGLGVSFDAPGLLLLQKRGELRWLATQPGELTLDLRTLLPVWMGGGEAAVRVGESWQRLPVADGLLRLDIAAATPYALRVPTALDSAPPRQGCRHFVETGHNLCGGFLAFWERNGGLALFGYPISEEFEERDPATGASLLVQYFERNRFEYHPELAGTPFEVQLGLLGNSLAAGRRDEEAFRPVASSPPERDLYAATGHTLGGPFRDHWERNGGLALFGYPISEEFEERNPETGTSLLVQYFERNRFEYHPELAGTPFEVQLGLLGSRLVDANGWR
jgi:hypothetical protein